MKSILPLLLILAFAAAGAFAQKASMSSVYTTLATDCRPETKVEADEVPLICKAVGGYRARVTPAGAWAETLEIVDANGEVVTSLGTHGYGYTTAPKRVLEWRMANGKPFAVIFRVGVYDLDKGVESGENPYLAKFKTGEKLLVRGLDGHGQIDFEVDAKKKDANAAAQSLADTNFQ